MRRLFPYPLLWLFLLAMWLMLNNSIGFGQILLGAAIATFACWAVARLDPTRSKVRRLGLIVQLFAIVAVDVLRSNIGVMRLILGHAKRRPRFLIVPLELKDPNALALLSCIITATPGSAWLDYDSAASVVTIHVLDVIDEDEWIATLKGQYEARLLEIFQ